MKLVTFGTLKAPLLGVVDAERGILNLKKANSKLPGDMLSLIEGNRFVTGEIIVVDGGFASST